MKKLLFVVLLGLIFSMTQSFAQNTFEESDFYYITVPVERIWLYREGYIVAYQRGFSLVRTHIPIEWFTPAGKADLIMQRSGSSWPHLTLFYENGQFSHLRLYVREHGHPTWGVVPFHVDLSTYFMNIEEIILEF